MQPHQLQPNDFVGASFWLVSAALLAATLFFFLERDSVSTKWKTSLTLSGLVTGIAFWHYLYMRQVWIETQSSPTVFRYIDWLLTVPLLIIEFYFILKAVTNVSISLFWKLFLGTLVMLIFGYLGETKIISEWIGFIIGCLGWFYIIYELWFGEGGKANKASGNVAVQSAYTTMLWIVILGWTIYPVGYFFGYLGPGANEGVVNIIYNIADFVNKILFGVIIWSVAKADSALELQKK
jgi:bacteriorhodopsin